MKSLATIKNLRSDMFNAERAYRQAIIQNLKEYGKELDVISEYCDEEDDFPKGVKVTSINDDDETFSCVADKIRYEEGEIINKASIHVVWYDGKVIDQWWGLDNLISEAADYILDSIVWPDEMDKGDQATSEADELEAALIYVREQLADELPVIQATVTRNLNRRLPAATGIDDGNVIDLLEEYGDNEGLPEGWWEEYGDIEDILLKL